MKNIIKTVAIVCLFVSFSCKKNSESTISDAEAAQLPIKDIGNVAKTKVEFDKLEHDFGQIEQGEVVETTFMMKNIGDNDLYIIDAHGSCGCTVPKVKKNVVKPGDSTPIEVKFDSNGKQGEHTKSINVRCNTENAIEQVKIKVNIKTK